MDDSLQFQIYKIAAILEYRLEKEHNKKAVEECFTNAIAKYLYDTDDKFREFIANQEKKNDGSKDL